jgi:hypothetical protein
MSSSVEQLTIGLYAIPAGSQPSASYAYYLLHTDPTSPPPLPSLDDLWSLQTLTGWYVFSSLPIIDYEAFKTSARANFPQITQPDANLPRGMVWLSDPQSTADITKSLLWGKNSSIPSYPRVLRAMPGSTTIAARFIFSAFALNATPTAIVSFNGNAFTIGTTDNNQTLFLQYGAQLPQQTVLWYGPQKCSMVLPLNGTLAGVLQFQVGLNLIPVQAIFGCTLAYFSATGSTIATLTYPFFVPPPQQPQVFNGFNVRLDPLNPLDSSRTRFAFDLSDKNNQNLEFPYFRAINGACISLIPQDPESSGIESGSPWFSDSRAAGFGFCLAPPLGDATASPDFSYYLAPVGQFLIQAVGSTQGSVARQSQQGDPFRWMCGLFGQEYLQLAIGDTVEFVSGKPAFANSAAQPASPNAPPPALDPTYTTSWLSIRPDLRTDQDAGAARGYFAQPSASVFFATPQGSDFPLAVDALLSPLDDEVHVPVVPYGGFTAGTPFVWPAGASVPTGASLASFEAGVLSSVRHAALSIPGRGPTFQISQPVLAGVDHPPAAQRALRSAVASTPEAGTAMTPQGLIVTLDPAGEWLSVLLAMSPDESSELLQFRGLTGSPGSVVSTDLSSVLMQNQLSLVVSDPAKLGTFDNNLHMGGFHFQFIVGPEDTILVFKYNTSKSLVDMVNDSSMWVASETFVGDSDAITVIQNKLRDAICVAHHEADAPGNPFGYFNKFSKEPTWTGILAFGAAIDGNGMPPDLQMLIGGIDGQLRAHHFGIESNHIKTFNNQLQIQKSSLLGVIHYDNPSASAGSGDFQYAVETLTVVFSNSMISQLQVSIGMTMNRLFERPVKLAAGTSGSPSIPNTMLIKGQYQNQDGIGAVLFSTNSSFDYEFAADAHIRVLDQVKITHASLTPTSSVPIGSPPGGVSMTATFGMAGQLYFCAAPFPQDPDLDLFSYGTYGIPGSGGLPFSSMTIMIAFDLDSAGKRSAPPTLTMDLTALSFQSAPSSIRPGSLLYSLPLQLSRFGYSPAGLSPSSLGAVPIQCLQLESNGTTASPDQTGPYPAVATAPHFALEYDMPLGSLGSLSDVTVGIVAKLLIGWGPSNVIPDNDAAVILVQLPAVFGGAGGFALEGILRTTFGDANLLKVDIDGPVYAILFSNIKFSVLGYSFPPGVLIDFVIFAGPPQGGAARNTSNIAWFLAAQKVPAPSSPPSQSYKALEAVR